MLCLLTFTGNRFCYNREPNLYIPLQYPLDDFTVPDKASHMVFDVQYRAYSDRPVVEKILNIALPTRVRSLRWNPTV
jgi:hypothetical protein